MVQDYMNTVCGFLGNDNCNDNDNGNGNGNGGKKLGDSIVYGSSSFERLIGAQTGLLVGYSFYGSFSNVKGNDNNTGKF